MILWRKGIALLLMHPLLYCMMYFTIWMEWNSHKVDFRYFVVELFIEQNPYLEYTTYPKS